MASVLLVSMPWCAASRPNLSVGVLKALAQQAGHSCKVVDANLRFADLIGAGAYEALAETPSLFGICEHVFACDLFPPEDLKSLAYLERFNGARETNVFEGLRDQVVPTFLDELEIEIQATKCGIVGFSCTFNQVFPSLALARRLKRVCPEKRILLGGACVHGEMGEEYARVFADTVDHVFLGEADESFVALLDALDRQEDLSSIGGITVSGRKTGEPHPIRSVEKVPFPDYDDFFETRRSLVNAGANLPEVAALPYEGSRGCWWGEKHHCTFCGLNNLGMQFRSKSAGDVANGILELSKRHQTLRFMASDNIITHSEFRKLLDELAGLDGEFSFFYEVKANLKRDDISALAKAGVSWIQPGIEAFSDAQLGRMKKGCSALQNVTLLRLCAEFGIRPSYNVLVGFPGETEQDYVEQIELAEKIMHLPAPSGAPSLVQIHRFSPFHNDPEGFGFEGVRPMSYYAHLLPPGMSKLERLAYFFDRDVPETLPYARMKDGLEDVISRWRATRISRQIKLGPGFAEVLERDAQNREVTSSLGLLQTAMVVLLDRPRTKAALDSLIGRLAGSLGANLEEEISFLEAHNLVVSQGGKLVSSVPYATPMADSDLSRWLKTWCHIDLRANTDAQPAQAAARSNVA